MQRHVGRTPAALSARLGDLRVLSLTSQAKCFPCKRTLSVGQMMMETLASLAQGPVVVVPVPAGTQRQLCAGADRRGGKLACRCQNPTGEYMQELGC